MWFFHWHHIRHQQLIIQIHYTLQTHLKMYYGHKHFQEVKLCSKSFDCFNRDFWDHFIYVKLIVIVHGVGEKILPFMQVLTQSQQLYNLQFHPKHQVLIPRTIIMRNHLIKQLIFQYKSKFTENVLISSHVYAQSASMTKALCKPRPIIKGMARETVPRHYTSSWRWWRK